MNHNFSAFALVCALALALTPVCWGQYNISLRVAGVPGESTAPGHEGDIDGTGFSLGITNLGLTNAGARATFTDVSVTKYVDKASPRLMLSCAEGTHLASVVLFVQSTSPAPLDYYKVTLNDVVVTRLDTGGSVGGKPVETVSFSYYGRIEIIYTPRNPDGSAGTAIRAGWDLKTNRSY
jgi:type VI secretion system secreted protein Hcp